MPKIKTLLVYEINPEDVKLYVLDDCPEWLIRCHGYYLNTCEAADAGVEDDLQKLSELLDSDWKQCELVDWKNEPLNIEDFSRLVHTGFIL